MHQSDRKLSKITKNCVKQAVCFAKKVHQNSAKNAQNAQKKW